MEESIVVECPKCGKKNRLKQNIILPSGSGSIILDRSKAKCGSCYELLFPPPTPKITKIKNKFTKYFMGTKEEIERRKRRRKEKLERESFIKEWKKVNQFKKEEIMGKKELSEVNNVILESFYTQFIDKMLEWELWDRNQYPTAQELLNGTSIEDKMDTLNTIKKYGVEDVVDTNVREQARVIVAGLSAPRGSVAARVRGRLGLPQQYDE